MAVEQQMGPVGQLIDWLKRQQGPNQFFGGKFYPVIAPQELAPPYCTVQQISSNQGTVTAGRASGASGLVQCRLQLDVYTATFADQETGSLLIMRCLHGYQGQMGSVFCQRATAEMSFSGWGDQPEFYRAVHDVSLAYQEC